MGKILGFTRNPGEDWVISSQYGTKEIQGIPDPEGGHAINAPTSIPSPFARMDLVRKSFQNIGESPNLTFYQRGETIVASKEDEKTVSQCLDLAEMLFFYENYKDKIEILEWNKIEHIGKLKNSTNSGHQKLGDVLDMYLRQDALAFNFDYLNSIYIIKFNHKVIGGTSPLTLFFNTATDGASLNLISTKGKTFFKDIVPLYDRDADFQKYIYLLFKAAPVLGERMMAFNEYLNKSLEVVSKQNPNLYDILNTLKPSELLPNYANLNTKDAGQIVEVFDVPFKTIDSSKIPVNESDFVIHSSKYNGASKPLVVQNNFNKPLKYVNGAWDTKIEVKYIDNDSLNQRTLPGLNIKYPYLTISDLLEDTLIRLVYPIDSENYFNGNLKLSDTDNTKSYLLPLKPLFFQFFDVSELLNGGTQKPHIFIEEGLKNGVRVLLRIPIKKGDEYIIFERFYYNDSLPDAKINKGAIVEQQVGLTIFPFIKYEKDVDAYYNIQLVDRNISGNLFDVDYQLSFYSDKSKDAIESEQQVFRTKKIKGDFTKVTTKYFGIKAPFDYIQVDSGFGKGIIIPKWRISQSTGDQFTFAIDFGTTNTHIEYSINNTSPKPFDITFNDIQAVPFFSEEIEHNFSGTNAIDLRNYITKEFVPKIIMKDTAFNFPIRTVLSQSKTQAPPNGGKALMEFNIPFVFEKETDMNSRYFTNLKWDSKEPNNDSRVHAFLEQVIIMIRNKVLLNGGSLTATKVVWTYPISMSTARKDRLSGVWNQLYQQYINKSEETTSLSESLAPYYYFKSNQSLDGQGYGTSVLMDIGGGTSDVVVYNNHIPELVSSYKFAGNTLFGDGYSEFGNAQNNMLIKRYKDEFDSLLEKDHPILKIISDELYTNKKSSDFNAFLFSLGNNAQIKDRKLFDFNNKLANNDDIKIIFLYFYAAKIFHVAKLIKNKGLKLPENLIFSGNGSKILNIITNNMKTMGEYTQQIFSYAYGISVYPKHGLKISVEMEIPKAITSKGSIIHIIRNDQEIDIRKIKETLTCLEHEGKTELLYSEIGNDEIQDKIVQEVEAFNNFFSGLLDSFDCQDKFGISYNSISVFKEISNRHIKQFLMAGIAYNNALEGTLINESAKVTDTLFFFPMVETIQQLIKELAFVEAEGQ
ncbi:hypothetical protein DBR11_14360 [Pedobacter sp. HMWF019]|uniref:hypothetical protein n=1 Tax=Pedobacter sp. HMWF019 TaxID=2056856 RepID=UPI000D3B8CC3|nr:hypothetical protein [Pedobacter sp. HMWF019]PTS98624.1 hypothetical protein DBR11_14360 [Pedobacter sp. HMWF019]